MNDDDGRGRRLKPAFVLGIDGLPYTLTRRLIEQGVMPNLGALAQQGTLARMQTTVPDFSCTAWTSFATGVNPGKHGIFGFHDFHPRDADIYVPTAMDAQVEPLWHAVGRAGGRSVVLNVPGTYPALPLRGKLSAGFVAPDFDKACYPAEFAQSLRELGYRTDFDGAGGMPDADSVRALLMPVFEARKAAIRHVIANEQWDLGIAVITETDRVQHFYLAALDDVASPDHPGVRQFYVDLDKFIGEVAAMLDGKADLYMVSDHGFAVVKRTIWLDEILRLHGLAPVIDAGGPHTPETAKQTRVFCLDPGRFYVNRKNSRFPYGRVPEGEVATIVNELKNIMMGLLDPETGEPVMEVVRTREEGFWGEATALAPDLVVAARAGYYLRALRRKGPEAPLRINWEGNHTWNDAIVFVPGRISNDIQPMIWDVLPTVLSGMGVTLPEEVDGRNLRVSVGEISDSARSPMPTALEGQQPEGKMANTKKPRLLKGVVTPAEMATLSEWALKVYESGVLMKNQSEYRNFNLYSQLPKCEVFEAVRARFAERAGLSDFPIDPLYENFLSVIFPGGFVQPHTDGAQLGCHHVRANLICQKPDAGGMPIIEDVRYEIAPGDMWVFLANEALHWTDVVEGSKPRINCSFGWAVPQAWWGETGHP